MKEETFKIPLLLFILSVAFIYRAVNLGGESVWWDEFSSVIHLSPPSEYLESPHYVRWTQGVHYEPSQNLLHFLIKNRTLDPATMPLYYIFEYLWHEYIDESIYSLRVLSIAIGLLLIFAVYYLGKLLGGTSVGIWAGLFVALSPIHRQFAQEIRMYALFTLLTVISFIYFVKWYKEGRGKFFFLYLLYTFLMLWTHPFAVLVPMVQGIYLGLQDLVIISLAKWGKGSLKATFLPNFMKTLKWGMAVFLIFVPSLIYISTIQFWDPELTSSWMKIPTFREFFGDLFADDCIGWTYQLREEPDLWIALLGEKWGRWIVSQRYLVGGILVSLFMSCLIFSVWRYYRNYLKCVVFNSEISHHNSVAEKSEIWLLLLWIWWLFPPIFLYVVSLIWRPCIMPRYTLHCSIALYLMIGFVISFLSNKKSVRNGLVLLLLAGYLYQTSLLVSKPQHTDWRGAGLMIKNYSKPEDIVLVENELWKRVFLYNLGPVPSVVCYGSNFENTSEIAYFILSKLIPQQRQNSKLWIVVQSDYFESAPLYHFEKHLKSLNIDYKYREFPGIQRVVVYYDLFITSPKEDREVKVGKWFYEDFSALALEFWRIRDYHSAVLVCNFITQLNPGYAQAYSYLGMSYKELQMWEQALENFKKAVELSPENYPWNWINIGDILINLGRYEEAIPALNEGIKILPNDSFAHTCLGKAYLGLGNLDKAKEYFLRAIQLDPTDQRPVVELQKLEGLVNR
ncbi:MAG: tetratricopeptide repeat protein [Candidatus Hydrogenedentes bacterium]|nr:tetratricopeptide repeat protein [Candidatus Hydrogenedentota bacterium]